MKAYKLGMLNISCLHCWFILYFLERKLALFLLLHMYKVYLPKLFLLSLDAFHLNMSTFPLFTHSLTYAMKKKQLINWTSDVCLAQPTRTLRRTSTTWTNQVSIYEMFWGAERPLLIILSVRLLRQGGFWALIAHQNASFSHQNAFYWAFLYAY